MRRDPRYGAAHDRLRARLARVVAAGEGYCWRPECHRWIAPGAKWHLGHRDDGSYGGIECLQCNLRDAAAKTNAKRRASTIGVEAWSECWEPADAGRPCGRGLCIECRAGSGRAAA